jgi:phosphohistidine phosphatase SixA
VKLYAQRHADAGERMLDDMVADDARQLSELGRQQAWWVGQVLREWGEAPELIIASPLPRTSETAYIISESLRVPWVAVPDLHRERNIFPLLSLLMRDKDMSGLYIVGHHDNMTPGFAALNGMLGDNLAEWPRGELRKLKVDTDTMRWSEKWRLHPAADAMTIGTSTGLS